MAPVTIGLGNFGMEARAVKIIPVLSTPIIDF